MIKDAKGKNAGKTIHHFHYFNDIDQYRIESPPVITGGLKTPNAFYLNLFYIFLQAFHYLTLSLVNQMFQTTFLENTF